MKKRNMKLSRKLVLGKETVMGCMGAANKEVVAGAPEPSKNCISIFMCDLSGIYCPETPEIHAPA